MNHELFNERHQQIAAGMIQRAYPEIFNYVESHLEVKLIKTCETRTDYFKASRVGRRAAINRKIRAHVWGIFQNAKDHADFEIEQMMKRNEERKAK